RRWAHLQKCLWPRSAGREPDARGSLEVQARRSSDQHLHAGVRLWAGPIRAEGHGDVPRQSLLHHALYARAVLAHGVHVEKDKDNSLARTTTNYVATAASAVQASEASAPRKQI